MLDVRIKNDDTVNINFSKNLISSNELMEFIERLRVKQLISESKLTKKDAVRLDQELKNDWWGKNKEKFLSKIK